MHTKVIKQVIGKEYHFLTQDQKESTLNHALLLVAQEHPDSTKATGEEHLPLLKSGFYDTMRCYTCRGALTAYIGPFFIQGAVNHGLLSGLLGVSDALARIAGVNVETITRTIKKYDPNYLAIKGADWLANKLCGC